MARGVYDLSFVYLTKTPEFLKPIASDLLWDVQTDEKVLYITFDDGPHPEVTPLVLEILKKFNAKATFFCVGGNVERNPSVFSMVKRGGHAIGNHTYDHESGWETSQYAYIKTYLRCQQLTGTQIFRPPYGKIKREQVKALKDHTQIIMWDVLSGDFDQKRDPEKCASSVIKHASPGSIIVFHDSEKARENVLGSLPKVLEHFANEGYRFLSLD